MIYCESSPALPQDYSGGDPKVILFVTFVDWTKLKFCDAWTNGQTDVSVEIVI